MGRSAIKHTVAQKKAGVDCGIGLLADGPSSPQDESVSPQRPDRTGISRVASARHPLVAHPMLGTNPQSSIMTAFPKKILLIDREPGVTRLIRRALEKTGKYWIKEEHDSQFALHSARWFHPDLILLDTMTTTPDREVLAREIQTDPALRQTPVVSLNSLKSESQMVSGGILSGYSFFSAPIRVEEVLRGVEQLLFGKG